LDYPNIIKQCLSGNRVAQKTLFDQFAAKMLFLCRRYAIDDNEAQDMVQEGFIRLFGNLEKFRNTGPFEGWVRRIFVNTAIKYYHKERHHNAVAAMEIVTAFENEESGIVDALSEQELMGLLSDLPDGYRVVFNLYAIEGYSHAEIASLLNIQESTSRSQLVKARKMLQTKVNDLQRVIL
jgi:RNA polymerase sigma-70 factor (ECF subfamily)